MTKPIKNLLFFFVFAAGLFFSGCSTNFSDEDSKSGTLNNTEELDNGRCVFHDRIGHTGHGPSNHSSFNR